MSVENLNLLFRPTSVALIGASNDPASPAAVILRNLSQGRFLGPVMPVNKDKEPIAGLESYAAIDTLPLTPDLAVFCTHPDEIPEYIDALGRRGTKAAVVLTQGLFRFDHEAWERNEPKMLKAAKKYGLRILGPNCLGYINPNVGINASLAHKDALPGKVAFVSQSDSLFTAVLDWAASKGVGFSHLISLGDRSDIHFGHVLDYLNSDPQTRVALLYIETIKNARAFMSAARATARNKPVLVIKAGLSEPAARAAAAHSGAYLGADDVYNAAFRRAGMLRVFDIDTLFDTVETLARTRPLRGDRLAVLTNGGSPGFLAVDSLMTGGGTLAELEAETKEGLVREIGPDCSYSNPLVIKSNSPPEIYGKGLSLLLKDKNVDAVLAMHVPTAWTPSAEAAAAVIDAAKKSKRNVLTSWLGIDDAEESRQLFEKAGLPSFFTPEKAVRGFLNMVEYRRNQEMLMQTPASLPRRFDPDPLAARSIVRSAVNTGRQALSEPEAKEVLAAYDIPIVEARISSDMEGIEGPVEAAEELGYPVALKVISPDIPRKSQAGGVVLDLENGKAVRSAAGSMLKRLSRLMPEARILGFTVQRMMRRPGAQELFIEVSTDPVFGPVIHFGQGGSLTDVLTDREVGLPPLNMSLARDLISRTRVFRRLMGSADEPQADIDAICLALVKISQLVVDIPEILELMINPLYADSKGVLALDAQIHAAKAEKGTGADQLAIRPYPKELEECAALKNGLPVFLRPIRPEDEPAHWDFINSLSAQDKRYRFFGNVGDLPRSQMIRFTQIDYDREMAFIAVGEGEDGQEKTVGVVRAMTDPDNREAEFAIVVRSELKGQGLGRILMEKIIRYCRSRGTNRIAGQALMENKGMAGLAKAVGFDVKKNHDEDVYDFNLYLNPS